MDTLSSVLTLPMSLAAAGAAHFLLSRGVKAVLWSVSPLATGEPQAYTYERDVWRTAEPEMLQVVVAVLASGLVMWIGAVNGWTWLAVLGAAAWFGALAFDLLRWERVAVSASNLWFQRGLRERVH